MTDTEFDELSAQMAVSIAEAIGGVVNSFYQSHGNANTNACFLNALALAVGTTISAAVFAYDDRALRRELYNTFDEVWRETAKKHVQWTRENQLLGKQNN